MAEVLPRAAVPARRDPGQQPQAGRGLLPRGRAPPTPRRRCAPSTSSTRSGRRRWRRCCSPTPASAPTARGACLALADIRTADASFVEQVRALGVEHPLLDEGLGRAGGRGRGGAEPLPGARRRRPQDRPRPRLLHRHGLRDPARRLRVASARSAPAAATTRSPATAARRTPASASRSASTPAPGRPRRPRPRHREPLGAHLRAGRRRATRRPAPRPRTSLPRLRARGISTEVAPTAAKFGKQIRHADRRGIPFVWFPGADGERTRSRTSGRASRSPADPTRWAPPAGGPRTRRPLTSLENEESHP